jgi:methylation protein EvaC
VTNFCGIGPDLIEFISDTTPGKQGRFSPGMHIPVVPYERFSERHPDYALLFAWNHAAEIVEKERAFREGGGRFIVYVPGVGILE